MVKHIVLFKLKESLSQDEKMTSILAFKSAIEALPSCIPFIRKVFVGYNINASEKWDICLESEFESLFSSPGTCQGGWYIERRKSGPCLRGL